MANTFKFGNGNWAVKDGYALAYNDENNNFKPLPFDFTRASSATRVNKQGLVEVVPSGKPRIDFLDNTSGHLLLEPSRTNLVTDSEDFSDSSYYKNNATITTDDTTSPDGNVTADKITSTGTTPYARETITHSTNTSYSVSIFAKKGNEDFLYIRALALSNQPTASFNLSTGVLGTVNSGLTAEIISLNNDWYRCIIKYTTSSSVPNNLIDFGIASSDNSRTSSSGKFVYFWGTQFEAGSYPTSYIPTEGSSVTRVAEAANGAGNSTVFNDSEGVLFFETATLANDSTFRNICISDSSTSDKIQFYYYGSNNNIAYVIVSASSTQASDNTKTLSNALEFNKIAIKYKQNDFALWVNGTEVATDSSGSTPIGLKEIAFDDGNGGSPFYGKVKNLRVYNTALTDTELQNLTS